MATMFEELPIRVSRPPRIAAKLRGMCVQVTATFSQDYEDEITLTVTNRQGDVEVLGVIIAKPGQ